MVLGAGFVLRDKRELAADGLPDQQAVKRVFMLKFWKGVKRGGIKCCKWQKFKTGL